MIVFLPDKMKPVESKAVLQKTVNDFSAVQALPVLKATPPAVLKKYQKFYFARKFFLTTCSVNHITPKQTP